MKSICEHRLSSCISRCVGLLLCLWAFGAMGEKPTKSRAKPAKSRAKPTNVAKPAKSRAKPAKSRAKPAKVAKSGLFGVALQPGVKLIEGQDKSRGLPRLKRVLVLQVGPRSVWLQHQKALTLDGAGRSRALDKHRRSPTSYLLATLQRKIKAMVKAKKWGKAVVSAAFLMDQRSNFRLFNELLYTASVSGIKRFYLGAYAKTGKKRGLRLHRFYIYKQLKWPKSRVLARTLTVSATAAGARLLIRATTVGKGCVIGAGRGTTFPGKKAPTKELLSCLKKIKKQEPRLHRLIYMAAGSFTMDDVYRVLQLNLASAKPLFGKTIVASGVY